MDKQHQSISLTFTSVTRKDFIKLPLTLTRRFVRTGDNEFVKMSSEDVRWSTQGRWFGCYYSYITTFVGVPKLRRSKNFSDDSACQVSADTRAADEHKMWISEAGSIDIFWPAIGLWFAVYRPACYISTATLQLIIGLKLKYLKHFQDPQEDQQSGETHRLSWWSCTDSTTECWATAWQPA